MKAQNPLPELWRSIVSEIEVDLGKTFTGINFRNSNLTSIGNGAAKISVANQLAKDNITTKAYNLLRSVVEKKTGQRLDLVFDIAPSTSKNLGPLFETPTSIPDNSGERYKLTKLNPKYTFTNLVVGSANNFAHAAAAIIAKNPGKDYNPFFLYGGVGVGKTHLMHAVGNQIFSSYPNLNILYISSEHFINDLVASIQNKTMPAFKKRYREVDVLLVDDIQFISGKESTQEEFFHTFNDLFMAEKQIIFTSDRPPNEIKVEDRLLSRLQGGLTTDIGAPDLEMRMAIINKKLEIRGERWGLDVVEYLATHYDTNIREVEGGILLVLARAQSLNIDVTLDLAKTTIEKGQTQENGKGTRYIAPNHVIDATIKITGIKKTDLLSPRRDAELVIPRQIIMYILHRDCGITHQETARLVNRKDHTTVIHAVEKIDRLLVDNLRIKQQYDFIRKELWG